MRKLTVMSILLLLSMGQIWSQTTETGIKRGFLLFGGLGFPGIIYEDALQDLVDQLEDGNGVNRLNLYMNLGIGVAVTKRIYITVGFNGYGDILSYSDSIIEEELQLTFVDIVAGLRFYPQVTGWVAGFDLGPARAQSTFDANYIDEEISFDSETGFGFGIMIGYDLARRPTGFSAIIGARADFLQIEEEMNTFGSLFLNLVFK